ncbi:MAG: hypothetical protein K940chlam7_01318, partial [Chlamydiae bacterium]|nr:hypothetical protein [Chlamydiota bacterium]
LCDNLSDAKSKQLGESGLNKSDVGGLPIGDKWLGACLGTSLLEPTDIKAPSYICFLRG